MIAMTLTFDSEALGRSVTMRAVLPLSGAYSVKPPLRTLYMLHGLNGSDRDLLTFTRIALYARERGLAVFFPAGENSFYLPRRETGEDYLKFVGEEIPEMTRSAFALSARREDTFIGGLSVGGYGALNAAFAYPQTFGKAIAFSAALRPWESMVEPVTAEIELQEARRRQLFGEKPERWDTLEFVGRCKEPYPEVYLACGLEDRFIAVNREFARDARALGVRAQLHELPGGHSWDFWDRNLPDALDFLLA